MKTKLLFIILFAFANATFAQLTDPIPSDDWAISQVGANNLLNNPYDIEIGPDGYLWITERTIGRISRFDPVTGAKDVLVTIASLFTDAQQDGLMGLVLHPQLGQNNGNEYVYAAYTYNNNGRKLRISRFTYTKVGNDGTLSNEFTIIQEIPASYDHNSGRLAISPDLKLHYTIGDQGNNQYTNYCNPINSQTIPTSNTDYVNYLGKSLRLNLDGTIPTDNPTFGGVKSHVFTIGHRNAQGLVFSNSGKLYTSEHGPRTDDEINILESGKNYGWPFIAGYNDNKSYNYCNWSSLANCSSNTFNENTCPAGATSLAESSWAVPTNFKEPMTTWGTVNTGYDFQGGCGFICWPTVAPSGMDIYEAGLIPNWGNSLITAALKRGRIYRSTLTNDGNGIEPIADPEPDGTNDDFEELWYTPNRYRDVVSAPDGLTFYIITDSNGSTSGPSNSNSIAIANPGIIIKVKYTGTVLSANSFVNNTNISLVPNPAKNEFKIDFQNDKIEIANLQINDINGRVILEISNPTLNQNIKTDNFNNGLYLVTISDKNGNKTTKKLIISK